jgi:hypothetical protein
MGETGGEGGGGDQHGVDDRTRTANPKPTLSLPLLTSTLHYTPLHTHPLTRQHRNTHRELLELLLERQANLRVRMRGSGHTPLMLTAMRGDRVRVYSCTLL